MAVKYVCCQCDIDMTEAVNQECGEGPVARPTVAATLIFKGMNVVHAARWVTATCPNGHTCSYPCSGVGHD
jgi:hypothetical protein